MCRVHQLDQGVGASGARGEVVCGGAQGLGDRVDRGLDQLTFDTRQTPLDQGRVTKSREGEEAALISGQLGIVGLGDRVVRVRFGWMQQGGGSSDQLLHTERGDPSPELVQLGKNGLDLLSGERPAVPDDRIQVIGGDCPGGPDFPSGGMLVGELRGPGEAMCPGAGPPPCGEQRSSPCQRRASGDHPGADESGHRILRCGEHPGEQLDVRDRPLPGRQTHRTRTFRSQAQHRVPHLHHARVRLASRPPRTGLERLAGRRQRRRIVLAGALDAPDPGSRHGRWPEGQRTTPSPCRSAPHSDGALRDDCHVIPRPRNRTYVRLRPGLGPGSDIANVMGHHPVDAVFSSGSTCASGAGASSGVRRRPGARTSARTAPSLTLGDDPQVRIVIVGSVAAGTSAGAKIRRKDKTAEIVIYERGSAISYSGLRTAVLRRR